MPDIPKLLDLSAIRGARQAATSDSTAIRTVVSESTTSSQAPTSVKK